MPSKLRLPDGTFVGASSVGEEPVQHQGITIPTAAGATNEYVTAPVTGVLIAAQVTPLVALAASDTNYITWSIVNLGQDNTGTAAMLAVSDLNTTKATGGVALAINTRRNFTLHGTAANLAVTKGDRLKIVATGTGTLANTVTVPTYLLTFSRTS